jgi:hypothetical protein
MSIKKFIRITLSAASALALLSLNLTCSNLVAPEDIQPGRRDYVWTVDTIKTNESLTLARIWGSSAENVWAVGSSSWTATTIWRYNGRYWTCDSIPRRVAPWAIFGFSPYEVWLGNTNSTIWKYDGNDWNLFGEYKVEGYDYFGIENFNGTSKNNIYGVGAAAKFASTDYIGIIMRYDGSKWSFINIPKVKVNFTGIGIDYKTNTLVLAGSVYDPVWINKVYTWNGKELKEIYSGDFVTVCNIKEKVFITTRTAIYEFADGKMQLWKDMSNTMFAGNILAARNEKDIFTGSRNGIGHYNGSDFVTIFETGPYISPAIIFEKDIFILERDYKINKNKIIRGTLKD